MIMYLELYVADIFWAFYIPLNHLIQTGTTVGVHSWTSPQLVLPLTRPLLPSATRFGSKTAEPSSVRSSAACRKSSFRSRRKPQEKEEARRRMQLPPQLSFLTPNSLLPPPPPLLWRQRVLGSVPNPWTSNWMSHQQNTLAASLRQRTMPQIRRTRVNLRERRWSVREQRLLRTDLQVAKDSALNQVRTYDTWSLLWQEAEYAIIGKTVFISWMNN